MKAWIHLRTLARSHIWANIFRVHNLTEHLCPNPAFKLAFPQRNPAQKRLAKHESCRVISQSSHPVARNRSQGSRYNDHKLCSFQTTLHVQPTTYHSQLRLQKTQVNAATWNWWLRINHKHIWTVTQYIHHNQCSLFLTFVINSSNMCRKKAKDCLIINTWSFLLTARFHCVIYSPA